MTCIIGYIDRKSKDIYIGADSSAVLGDQIFKRSDEKVFINGPMIFGFAGSFRMGQILRYSFEIPKQSKKKNDYEYLCTDFVDKLMECFTKKGFAEVEDNVISGGTFLLGYKGNLYEIGPDFQVGKDLVNYAAIGIGEQFARGALYILDQAEEMSAEQKVYRALEASEEFSSSVTSPFSIMKISIDGIGYNVVSDQISEMSSDSSRTYNKLKKKD
jgi:ATP-dependent protease HslVU (ClpYQ) peptidase subunit